MARYQLGWSSLYKSPLSRHKTLASESSWLAQPVCSPCSAMESQKWSTRHLNAGIIWNVNAMREGKVFSNRRIPQHSKPFSTMPLQIYNVGIELSYASTYESLRHESSSVRTVCSNINALWITGLSGWENTMYSFFSPFRTVNPPLWKDLIKGHTVTTFHLASDWMPSASFRNQSLWSVGRGLLLVTW